MLLTPSTPGNLPFCSLLHKRHGLRMNVLNTAMCVLHNFAFAAKSWPPGIKTILPIK